VGYISSLTNLTNVTNVNSLQGVFSSIGVNCNFPAHRLDVNGKLNVYGNAGFGLIQAQGATSETLSFYLDPVNAGTPVNTGWITGQTTSTGNVGAANITTFGVTRVNNSVLSQYGYYMTSNGSFGINNNNPVYALDVVGQIRSISGPNSLVGGINLASGLDSVAYNFICASNNGGGNIQNSLQLFQYGPNSSTGIPLLHILENDTNNTFNYSGFIKSQKPSNLNSVMIGYSGSPQIPSILFSSNSSTAGIGFNAGTNTLTYGFGTNACNSFLGAVSFATTVVLPINTWIRDSGGALRFIFYLNDPNGSAVPNSTYFASPAWFYFTDGGNGARASISSTGDIVAKGSLTANGTVLGVSDIRLKENVITIDNALERISQMRGVFYNKIDDPDKIRSVGVIAQEIETILPEVVHTDIGPNHYKSVAYGNITGVLIEGIKAQAIQISTLQSSYNTLLSQMSTVMAKLV
jgi:hypothetical protein